MKRKISLAIICIFLLSITTAFGADIEPYASNQISSYSIIISGSGTTLNITADVEGTVPNLKKVGFNSIEIYEKDAKGSWVAKHTVYQLFSSNTGYHKSSVNYTGVKGKQYYATAYIYAEDLAGGSTTRTITSSAYTL